MSVLEEQIAQLEAAIAAQEALRPTLGDAVVNGVIAALRAQLDALRAQSQTDHHRLNVHLSQLERAELIRFHASQPEVEYIFKHALTQDAAYQSLLIADRKVLHRKVGEAMETLFADRLGEVYGILGEHFQRGEVWDKAAEYLIRAGEAAVGWYANAEARLHYAGALAAMSHLSDTDDNRRRRVDILIKQVGASLDAEAPEPNLVRVTEAEGLAQELVGSSNAPEDRLRLARVQLWMGRTQARLNRPREAIDYYRQVLAVAEEFGDEELSAIPSSAVGRALFNQGRYGEATPLLAQAVAPLEKSAQWTEWISNVVTLGMALVFRGQYAAGVAEGQRALDRALAINSRTDIAFSYATLSIMYDLGEDFPRALEASRIAVEMAEQSHDWVIVCIGEATWALAESQWGHHEAALIHLARCKAVAQTLGRQLLVADRFAVTEAEIVLNVGRAEEAFALAEQAVTLAQSIGGLYGEGWAHRVWGQALARVDPPRWAEAEAHLAESLRLLESGDALLAAARTHVAWGMICRDLGNTIAAREHFESAAAQFKASELTEEWKRTHALLAALKG